MKTSPFYCYVKNCRKTIWGTPNYIKKADLKAIHRLIECLEMEGLKGFNAFNSILSGSNKVSKRTGKVTERIYDMFFNRVIGWPEGVGYYMNGSDKYRQQRFNWMQENDLPRIKEAIRKIETPDINWNKPWETGSPV